MKNRLFTNHYSLITNFGFTLLELLVVIGIIGILTALATLTFTAAQRKSRDAKRKADLKATQDAFEQYYAFNNSNYPGTGNCDSGDSITISGTETFIIPTDPRNDATYYYNDSVCSTLAYCVCARLEANNGGNSSGACTWLNNGAFYCISNLQ